MKPGVFTQMHVQLVFAVKNRDAVLTRDIRKRVFEYLSGITTKLKHKSIIVNGMPDHVHVLFGLNPSVSISDTVHDLKRSTSLLINNEKLFKGKFAWQEGYGAFSYSRSQLDNIYNYIKTQEEHHKRKTFKEEYIELLEKFEIEFNHQFLFDFFDS